MTATRTRPLSDLGQLSYKSFWTEVLVQLLWEEKCEKRTHSTVEEMSARTYIKEADIVTTLQSLNLVQYWRGQYIVNPNSRLLEEHAKAVEASLAKRLVRVKPECLSYTPRIWELYVLHLCLADCALAAHMFACLCTRLARHALTASHSCGPAGRTTRMSEVLCRRGGSGQTRRSQSKA